MNIFIPVKLPARRIEGFLAAFAVMIGIFFSGSFLCAAEEVLPSRSSVSSASEIDYPPFCIVDEKGRAGGFSVELLRAALGAMGRGVSFRTGTWQEVKGWLQEGEVQALPLVGRTPERESIFDFTFPYMSLHGAVVVREGTEGINDLSDLRGRRVAVMKGDNAEEFLRREDRGIDIRPTATFEQALRELAAGLHDAVVVQRLVALRIIQKSGLRNLRILNKPIEGFRQDFCFAVREGDRETLALLNEGLALVMADGTYRHLHVKWFAALELPSGRPIIIGGDHNYPPFEYLDEKGRPAGFNVELTRAIAKEMNLDIEIRLGSWTEIRQALARGEIDAVQGMYYSAERDLTFDFTPSHTANNYVAVIRREEGDPPSSLDGLTGKKIVVQDGDIMHDLLEENGGEYHLSEVDAQEDALRELAAGKHDIAVVARLTALYWIRENGWQNLTVGRRPLLSPGYSYAVPHNQKALLAELTEGLKVLDEIGEYRRIYQKWLGVYEDTQSGFQAFLHFVAILIIPLLFLLFVIFLWSWSLRKKVAQRTKDLQRSETLLNSAQRISKIGGWEWDAVSRNMFWTRETYRIHDYKPDTFSAPGQEHIERSIECYAEEDRAKILAAFERCLAEGVPYELECRFTSAEGRRLWIRTAGEAVRQDSRIVKVVGYIQDISEIKKAEEKLRDQNHFIRTILDNLPIGLAVSFFNEGTVAYMNRRFEEIYGWPAEELKDVETFFEKVYPDPAYRQEIKTRVLQDVESGDLERMTWEDIKITGKDGTGRIVTAKNIPLVEQNMMISTVRDETERKIAERKLAESEKKFRLLVESSPGAIFLQANGTFTYLNRAAVRLFGAESADDLIGTRILDRLHADFHDAFSENMKLLLHEDRMLAFDKEIYLRLDGTPVEVEVSAVPFEHEERNGTLFFVHDISERIAREKAHEALQEQFIQAQKMESVGRLAGGVAHDYNNMLNVILGYAEIVEDELGPDHPLHGDIVEIIRAGKRSAGITRQLLAFARKQTVAPMVLDLNETMGNLLNMLKQLIGEDIDLAWFPGEDLWPARIDPGQVDQIMMNLCVNARDAIAGVGNIIIETRNTRFDAPYCADHPGIVPGEYVMFSVTDDGCGIEPETLDKIFEPFFSTKGVGKGTGLGLATVYGIVKQNNGFVNVYSEPGKGTTFKVYLPRYSGTAAAEEEGDIREIQAGREETILFVEDELPLLKLGVRMLESQGYAVLPASTPGEAVRLAEQQEGGIDLLITDVVMPEMNGRELAGRLQSRYPSIRVLFMSGYSTNVIAHRGMLEENTHFIQKPFSKKELMVKIREVLDG